MDESIRQWFLKIEGKLDTSIESTIRLEGKVDALTKADMETDQTLKAYELRLSALEKEQSRQDGALRTLHRLGALLVGIAIIGATVVAIFK